MFIYLDESGDLLNSREKYFIVASFTVSNPSRITKEFRKWQKSKFPKLLKNKSEVKFNEALKTRLLPKLPANVLVQIETVDSTSSPQVQVADWLCGALGRYYEEKKFGKEFFNILKPTLVRGEELFSAHWEKIWKK